MKRAVRVFNKVRGGILRAVGIDDITGKPVLKRPDMVHIGTKYGGWVVPVSLLDRESICYCVGCGEDISFDLGLIDRFGCQVYGFDPTPRSIAYVNEHARTYPQYHFAAVGLWNVDDTLRFYGPQNPAHVSHSALNLQKTERFFEARVRRLAAIMAENGHGRLDLLKLDIEGAEYKVIDSMLEDGVEIGILCVEFDEALTPLDGRYRDRIKQYVDRVLASNYDLVYAQGAGNYTFVRS